MANFNWKIVRGSGVSTGFEKAEMDRSLDITVARQLKRCVKSHANMYVHIDGGIEIAD